jgi:hypothetical protein
MQAHLYVLGSRWAVSRRPPLPHTPQRPRQPTEAPWRATMNRQEVRGGVLSIPPLAAMASGVTYSVRSVMLRVSADGCATTTASAPAVIPPAVDAGAAPPPHKRQRHPRLRARPPLRPSPRCPHTATDASLRALASALSWEAVKASSGTVAAALSAAACAASSTAPWRSSLVGRA